jgi:hypothetical protein
LPSAAATREALTPAARLLIEHLVAQTRQLAG